MNGKAAKFIRSRIKEAEKRFPFANMQDFENALKKDWKNMSADDKRQVGELNGRYKVRHFGEMYRYKPIPAPRRSGMTTKV